MNCLCDEDSITGNGDRFRDNVTKEEYPGIHSIEEIPEYINS